MLQYQRRSGSPYRRCSDAVSEIFHKMCIRDSCKAMKEQAVKNARTEEQKASIKDVGRQQLRSWGILLERDGKDYPSNAFAILTGNGGLHVATQCGVFKGTTKAVFVDRREYTGCLLYTSRCV